MYDVPSYSDVTRIVIEESTVRKGGKPVLIGKNGDPIELKSLS